MKTKIIAFIAAATLAAAAHASTQPGWGSKQTKRTVGGILSGATVGGIIGHQHGKQKEGIIIGTVLGGIIGNMSGKGSDHRDQQRAEQASMSARERYFARRQAEQREHFNSLRNQDPRFSSNSGNTTCRPAAGQGSLHNDPEIVAARQRAEQAELELQRQQQIRQRELERQRLLNQYAEREARASRELSNY